MDQVVQEQVETMAGMNGTNEELLPANMDHIIQQEQTDISMTPKRETLSPCDNPALAILGSDDGGHGNYLTQKRDSGPTIVQTQGRLALTSSRKPISDINVTGHTSHLDSKVQFAQIRNG